MKTFAKRVVRKLKKMLGPKPPSPLRVNYHVAIEWAAKRQDEYLRVARYLDGKIPPYGAIIDVGANIGYFSFIVANALNFKGDVHLFEPIQHLADCARRLVRGDSRFTVHEFGLSDQNVSAIIHVAADGNLGWNTLISERASNDMVKVPIDLMRFDELEIGDVDFIKIDVEGAEYLVLAGMYQSIKEMDKLPLILVEIGWGKDGHPHWETELFIFEQFRKLGYECENLEGERLDLNSLTGTQDIVLVPQSK